MSKQVAEEDKMRPTLLTVCRGILQHDDVREYIATRYPGLVEQIGIAVADYCAARDNLGLEYLRKRLREMGKKYHDAWGRWTYRDYCAVLSLVDYVAAEMETDTVAASEEELIAGLEKAVELGQALRARREA